MTYIKKLVMHGFKSFAGKTEILFDKGITTIIGPNGSGKSNVADALCFVLGRLSTKSMRAEKAKNLLFMGSKYVKPSHEAYVEIIFDNLDRAFPIDKEEIVIKRIVKHSGIGVYKINDEVKTRAEIIEALAQAGIDPHGFNLILQGQIQSIVRMHSEDRRKIIEEVAGIAIYESRKEKSLHELEKTDEKLKEINAILRERTAFLRNLENERSQALKFKDLELMIKRCKASILSKKIKEKESELANIGKSIADKTEQKDKIRNKADDVQKKIEEINTRIMEINKHIQRSTGLEQESLRNQISNLKAECEGLRVRKENLEHRRIEMERRMEEMQQSIPQYEKEIESLRKGSPLVSKKREELKRKKEELEAIETERKKAHVLKMELASVKDRLREKSMQLSRTGEDSNVLLRQLEEYAVKISYKSEEECQKSLLSLHDKIKEHKKSISEIISLKMESHKGISSSDTEIKSSERIKEQISKIDICPLCQSKMTSSHISHVMQEADAKISLSKLVREKAQKQMEDAEKDEQKLTAEITSFEKKSLEAEREMSIHSLIKDRKDRLKHFVEYEKSIKKEISDLESKRQSLEIKTLDISRFDEQYARKLIEIEEASSLSSEDIDRTLVYKERELEKIKEVIKLSRKDAEELIVNIDELQKHAESRAIILQEKEEAEKVLSEQFKRLFKERDELQSKIQTEGHDLSTLHSASGQIEEQINSLKIGNARLSAEKESLGMEISEFYGIEIISASLQVLEERLKKSQESISLIGSINLRALEIYDEIKKEYDRVQEKATLLDTEKQQILNIISEIDNKKKKTFMKTFKGLNELFSSNFSKLSSKGQAFLEIENQESIFEGGINIVIRMAKGKYFDVTSLSGGEQTLVALSLLFAIQEYKPYHFYIFDEIDAALDKRNSERLSALLKQYMKAGQYITITHNDALIMDSDILYGVSMHEGVSKILGLKLGKDAASVPNVAPENKDINLPFEKG